MRKLRHHETKLLKKVNFFQWKSDNNLREIKNLRRFGISDREEYHKYNKLCGLITKLVSQLRTLPSDDEARVKMAEKLCAKLTLLGVVKNTDALPDLHCISASSFCRRRLSTVLVRLKYAENIEHAVSLIQQDIRIGPDLVTDPAVHVSLDVEDHITWAEGSSMKRLVSNGIICLRKIKEYLNEKDDYDLMF